MMQRVCACCTSHIRLDQQVKHAGATEGLDWMEMGLNDLDRTKHYYCITLQLSYKTEAVLYQYSGD